MLFMVIERFRHGTARAVGGRFREHGRMLPEGVSYMASWVDESGGRCFQLMSAPEQAALGPWMARWEDLIEFEVTPVLDSAAFWSRAGSGPEEGSSMGPSS